MSFTLGVIPPRYEPLREKLSPLDLYFATCRGYQKNGLDVTAMEMTKWFDTNYHYIVPEFVKNQTFSFFSKKIIEEYIEAKALNINTKPVLICPISYLLLGKEKELGFDRMELIHQLLPVYIEIIGCLENEGAEYIQLDEPFLVMDISDDIKQLYKYVYRQIRAVSKDLKIIVATYFGSLGDNLDVAISLPINILHVDLVRGVNQLEDVLRALPTDIILSLGLIDGRNIWKNDYIFSLGIASRAIEVLGYERVWLAPSCSLLHVPYDLNLETDEKNLPTEIKNWMAFAIQKLEELVALAKLTENKNDLQAVHKLEENINAIRNRKNSTKIHKPLIKEAIAKLNSIDAKRDKPFEERIKIQNQKLQLPCFPTTTIGSFPQTSEIRNCRAKFKKGEISTVDYEKILKSETENCIRLQEEIGLDVLVHGEFERTDMVEYFGELLDGFAFTQNGWVQSYGSRGVKPPIIFGDIERHTPMTVKWAKYAQALTTKKVKGMLTGPITILQWSFVRNDQPRRDTAMQIALALQHEVLDLEKAGIEIIQIDEPALREGLPLRRAAHKEYLNWAIKAFRICSLGVKNETQIHTHMCYADFNDIIGAIASMDADVITIETSRSQMELLDAFANFNYPNQIGPGVYDIHSPRIPSVNEMKELIEAAMKYIPKENLWINPDCGLKTRRTEETIPALKNMVEAAIEIRKISDLI